MDNITFPTETQYFIGAKGLANVQAGFCFLKTCPNMRCLETWSGKTGCVNVVGIRNNSSKRYPESGSYRCTNTIDATEKRNPSKIYTELNTTLHDACMVGDLTRVKYILSHHQVNINSIGKYNMTPVMLAAKRGHSEVFDLLLMKGANMSLFDYGRENILHLACIGGSVEIVKCILTHNIVGINSRGKDGMTPAMNAALYRRKDVLDLLVEAGADLLLVNEFGGNILHVACEGGNIEIIKHLLKYDVLGIDSPDMNGWTPVMDAVLAGHKDVFDVLVDAGADLLQVTDDKATILHVASERGNIEIVKYLMKHANVDIDSRDTNGWTPVMQAASEGHKDVFDVLLEAGADLSQVGADKDTIFHLACQGGNIEIIKYLLSHVSEDIDGQDADGWTPIMHAVYAGHIDVLKFLVEKGADILKLNEEKRNILHMACKRKHLEIIQYLVKLDIVDIDSRDVNGWTPVMHAASAGNEDVFDVLLEAGADLSQVDNDKETILHLASGGGNVQLIKYLLLHISADIDSQDANGWTPVMNAVFAGHMNVLKFLVEKEADILKLNDERKNILHLACETKRVEIIKYLVKLDIIDIDSQDVNGWTPVMYAANAGYKDMCDVLIEAGADLSPVNDDKETVLHLASDVGNVEIIKNLLKRDIVDIDSRDANGLTPVMKAVYAGHMDALNFLVEKGADLSKVNGEKASILHMACERKHLEIIKYLLDRDVVDINSRDNNNFTPVMRTVIGASNDVFDILVKWGADLSLLDGDNDNILHLACDGGSVEIVRYILTHNIVDINSRDEQDRTPVMIAARYGHEATFFLLVENGADLTIMNDIGDNLLNMACEGENERILKYVSTRHVVEGSYRKDDPC